MSSRARAIYVIQVKRLVQLANAWPGLASDNPAPLEEWRFDRETLQRLYKRDAVGGGYTLFLPWGTYKSEITQVRLRLRYEPTKGTPLYNESSTLVLRKDDSKSWRKSELSSGQPKNKDAGKAAG